MSPKDANDNFKFGFSVSSKLPQLPSKTIADWNHNKGVSQTKYDINSNSMSIRES